MSKRRTTEQFKNEVHELVGDEYIVLGTYKSVHTKILIKHELCNTTYEVEPNSFLHGRRCPKCFGTPKKNTEQFKNEMYELVNNEYEVIGNYVNSVTKILVKHNLCGNKYYVRPDDFLHGERCPLCSNKRSHDMLRKTDDEFKLEVYQLVKNEYSVLGKYVNTNSKILIEHNKCGYKWKITPKNFLNGNRCPACSGNIKKTTNQFKKEAFELVGNEYSVIGEYKNAFGKITFRHNKCGHIFKMAPAYFLKGQRCPKCFGTPKKTIDEYKKEVFELYKGEYTILDNKYNGNKFKLKTKHVKCGNVFYISPNSLLRGTGCPKCAASKGEKKIRKYLIKNHVDFTEQFRIKECKDKLPLPFDFAIFSQGKLIFLCEYQGEQHYIPMRFSNANKKFKKTILHDKIKENYCKKNNIKLVKIPYTRFNKIEDILSILI